MLELLCIGNALVDLFAQGEKEFPHENGISRPVQHIEMEKLQKIISELAESTPISGGGAANVAKISSLMGAKVCFTGAVGTGDGAGPDHYGRLFEKELIDAGVELRLSRKPSPTGLCLYLKAAGETYIAASPSAALEFSEDDISEEDIQKAGIVVIDGFMLSRPNLVNHILRLADKHEKTIALDISSVFIAREQAAEILSYAKRYSLILFMNEKEFLAFYEKSKELSLDSGFLHLLFESLQTKNKTLWPASLRSASRKEEYNGGYCRRRLDASVRVKSEEAKPQPGVPVIVVKLGSKGSV
jgi:sugar/nucleoside kinase (ribokinase family)